MGNMYGKDPQALSLFLSRLAKVLTREQPGVDYVFG
jgi:ribosomal protein S18